MSAASEAAKCLGRQPRLRFAERDDRDAQFGNQAADRFSAARAAEDRESAYEKLRARAGSAGSAGSLGSTGSVPGSTRSTGSAGSPAVPSALQEILFGTTGPRGGHHDGLVLPRQVKCLSE
jgi:hypothetical protein